MAELKLDGENTATVSETPAPDSATKGKKKEKKNKKTDKPEKELSPKKKAKLEKKADKAETKALRKEAKAHSLKIERRRARWTRFLAIILIIAVLATTGILGYTFFGILNGSIGAGTSDSDSANPGTNTTPGSNTTPTPTPANNNTTPGEPSSGTDGNNSAAPADAGDLSTPAGVVAYYKSAHAKTLAEAKSVSQVYSNTLNYNTVLEIGNSSAIASVAKTLMGQFLKEDTTKVDYSGGDIANMFPGKSAQNLTADMVAEATCKDNGDTYTIFIKLNSSEQSPDNGTNTACIVPIVDEKSVTDAAGSLVKLEGLANDYVGGNATITVDKANGRITHVETDCPSYMKFSKAGVAFVTVDNCRIGLEYQTKWDVNY